MEKSNCCPDPKDLQTSMEQTQRPISPTDHFAKLAETFATEWILSDIKGNIDINQFGNRAGYSTSHYLVKLMNNLYEHADIRPPLLCFFGSN